MPRGRAFPPGRRRWGGRRAPSRWVPTPPGRSRSTRCGRSQSSCRATGRTPPRWRRRRRLVGRRRVDVLHLRLDPPPARRAASRRAIRRHSASRSCRPPGHVPVQPEHRRSPRARTSRFSRADHQGLPRSLQGAAGAVAASKQEDPLWRIRPNAASAARTTGSRRRRAARGGTRSASCRSGYQRPPQMKPSASKASTIACGTGSSSAAPSASASSASAVGLRSMAMPQECALGAIGAGDVARR